MRIRLGQQFWVIQNFQGAQHCVSQTPAATCCNLLPLFLFFCVWFVCVSLLPRWSWLFIFRVMHPYNCSPVVVVRALSGRRALLRAMVHASLASLYDLLVNSAYGVGVAPPHALRWKISSFLESQWRGDTGAIYLWNCWRASCQKSWGCLCLGSQLGAGWFQQVSTAVFTHRLLCLLERLACKALIAH